MHWRHLDTLWLKLGQEAPNDSFNKIDPITFVFFIQDARINLDLGRPLHKCILNESRSLAKLEITFWLLFWLETFQNHFHWQFILRLLLNYYCGFWRRTSLCCFVFRLASSYCCCNLLRNFTLSFSKPLHQLGHLLISHDLSNPSAKLTNTCTLFQNRSFRFNLCNKSFSLPLTLNCNLKVHWSRSDFFCLFCLDSIYWYALVYTDW